MVFDERVDGRFAGAGADGENGEFASEGDKTFEDQFYGRQLGLRFGDVLCGAENPLAFAVVTHARSFQYGGEAERFYGGVEFSGIRNGGEFGGGNAELAEEILFGEAVLRGFESRGRRIHGNALGQKIGGFDGDVFEFVGDQLEAGGEFLERGLLGVSGRARRGEGRSRGLGGGG